MIKTGTVFMSVQLYAVNIQNTMYPLANVQPIYPGHIQNNSIKNNKSYREI